MAAETTGKNVSADRVRSAARAYGQQKLLAANVGMTESTLSKYLDSQLSTFNALLNELGLEVVDRGEVEDLRRVLKRAL